LSRSGAGFLKLRLSSSLSKLVIFYLTLQSLLTLAIIVFSVNQNRKWAMLKADEQLRSATAGLLPSVQRLLAEDPQSMAALERLVVAFKDATEIRVTVIDVDGKVLVDTDVAAASMANHRLRPEIVQAREFGFGKATRQSESANTEFYYLAMTIPPPSDSRPSLGYLRLAMATAPVLVGLKNLSQGFIGFAVITTILTSTVLLWLGRTTVAPLQDLMQFSKSIAKGDYRKHLNKSRWSGEWRLLGNAFEDMQGELESRENDLRENGDRLAAVMASMSEGIVAIDGNRHVLLANRASALLLEVPYQELVHHPFYELVRIPLLEAAIEEVFTSHRTVAREIESKRHPKRILEVRLSWLAQSDGEVVVIVLHDVTNLRQLETMRRDFVANVSHELKTPLSSIKAYSETLRLGAVEDPSVRMRFVERIEEQAKRLNDLIMDLIQLARIESGLATFELTSVNLSRITAERIKAFQPQAAQRNLRLDFETEAGEILIRCDTEGLVTIIDNLVSNAVKYTPEGGQIQVRCSRDDQADVGILEVVDNGLGIAPEFQERVFERFFRVDKARSSDIDGTGLGLSIVKHLAQSFSGQVSLASRLGKGSTFTVKLPLTESKKTSPAEIHPPFIVS
jgi:two-component system phosphate regulon sensor histidine kinase PhoR